MSEFVAGDKVLVNRGIIAEIVTYDVGSNTLVYIIKDGNSENRVHAHVSNTTVEHYPTRLQPEVDELAELRAEGHTLGLADVQPETPEAGAARVNAENGDAVTTSEGAKRGPGRPRKVVEDE